MKDSESRRKMMEDAGWTCIAKGVYTKPFPKVDRDSESYKELERKYEEWKRLRKEEDLMVA